MCPAYLQHKIESHDTRRMALATKISEKMKGMSAREGENVIKEIINRVCV